MSAAHGTKVGGRLSESGSRGRLAFRFAATGPPPRFGGVVVNRCLLLLHHRVGVAPA